MTDPIPERGRMIMLRILAEATEQTVWCVKRPPDWPDWSASDWHLLMPIDSVRQLVSVNFMTEPVVVADHFESDITPTGRAYIEAWRPNGWDSNPFDFTWRDMRKTVT